jgi:hypothetical protein
MYFYIALPSVLSWPPSLLRTMIVDSFRHIAPETVHDHEVAPEGHSVRRTRGQRDDLSSRPTEDPQPAASSRDRCSAESSRSTAPRLSSSCATEDAPTNGITGSSPPIIHASTT